MTIYYDPEQGPVLAALHFRHTIFSMLCRLEYWVILMFHIIFIVVFKYIYDDLGDFNWEAAGSMQIFMMFMLIFYNTACYQRYQTYYSNCMSILRHGVLFTEELVTSLPFEDCEQHRVTATRYILSAVHLFYFGLKGFSGAESWVELKRKGLVQETEIAILEVYPAQLYVLLSNWAMQVVGIALTQDCFWTPNSAHIGHVYNRLNNHVLGIIGSCNKVRNVLAMPIPYPYWHLTNFVMVFNFFVLAFALATVKSWGTILAFGFAELIYLGMRTVSVNLSEPFSKESSDFPLACFLDYVFDHCVGLLEAFSHPLAYARLHKLVTKVHSFTEDELVASCLPAVKYDQSRRTFVWGVDRPLSLMHKEDVKKMLSHALVDPDDVKETIHKSEVTWTPEELKAYSWKCHHCGKLFRPDFLECKRCGRKRLKQAETPPDQEDEVMEIHRSIRRAMTSALDFQKLGIAKGDDEELEDMSAKEESLRMLAERRNQMESLRDKLGAARVRLAVLKAEAAGSAPRQLMLLGSGSFQSTLDSALALENAPTEFEESGAENMSPVLARSAEAYNSHWAARLRASPHQVTSPGAGMSPAVPFDQAQQQLRRNLNSKSA